MRVASFFKTFLLLAFVLFAVVSPAFSEDLAPEVVVALKPDKDPDRMFPSARPSQKLLDRPSGVR